MKPALSAAVSLLALIAGAAHAEPNITGMWALDEPAEWKAATRNAPVLPEVMARQQAIQKRDTANHRIIGEDHTKCLPSGMPGLMQPPFGIEFLQTKGRITILSEVSNLPRSIYLDEKKHPDYILPGWNGHSIGHWEKDTLMVDTIGFNGRIARVSTKAHITEKMYLTDKGQYLVDEITMDDPETYTKPYSYKYRYKKVTDPDASEVMEYVCEVNPDNLAAFVKEEADWYKAQGKTPPPPPNLLER